MRNSALTVPCEATSLTGSPRHCGNCPSTSSRTVSAGTASCRDACPHPQHHAHPPMAAIGFPPARARNRPSHRLTSAGRQASALTRACGQPHAAARGRRGAAGDPARGLTMKPCVDERASSRADSAQRGARLPGRRLSARALVSTTCTRTAAIPATELVVSMQQPEAPRWVVIYRETSAELRNQGAGHAAPPPDSSTACWRSDRGSASRRSASRAR